MYPPHCHFSPPLPSPKVTSALTLLLVILPVFTVLLRVTVQHRVHLIHTNYHSVSVLSQPCVYLRLKRFEICESIVLLTVCYIYFHCCTLYGTIPQTLFMDPLSVNEY